MLLPKLFGNVRIFVVVFVVAIVFDGSTVVEKHPTIRRIIAVAPYAY